MNSDYCRSLKRSKSNSNFYDLTKIAYDSNWAPKITYDSNYWAHTWFRNIVLSHGDGGLVNEGGSKSIFSSDSHPIGKFFYAYLSAFPVSIILLGFCVCCYTDFVAILYLVCLISTISTFIFGIVYSLYREVTHKTALDPKLGASQSL